MISAEDALAAVLARAEPTERRSVAFSEAVGLVLAEPASARLDHPPADVSAMDGYAIRGENINQFSVIAEARAGEPHHGELAEGEAVRVFTGSVVPAGAERIVIQEDVEASGDVITVKVPQAGGRNIRAMAGDFARGDELLPAGHRITPRDLALLAGANVTELTVHTRPIVVIFANGDELVAPGQTPAPGQVVNSTPYALIPLIEAWGGVAEFLGIAPDTPEDVAAFFDRAAGADIVMPIGGASVGDYDHVKRVGKNRYEFDFEKVAMKPGKPCWFGAKDRQRILGVPGNPGSALTCAYLFLRPLIAAMAGARGQDGWREETAILDEPLPANGTREEFVRARAYLNDTGRLVAAPAGSQDSSMMGVFAAADGFIRRPAGHDPLPLGSRVRFLPF